MIDPGIIVSYVSQTLESYGWLIVLGCMIFYYFYQKIPKNLETKSDYKNYEQAEKHDEKLYQTRVKMQEKFNKLSNSYLNQQFEKEEQIRLAKLEQIEKQETNGGHRLNSTNSATNLDGPRKRFSTSDNSMEYNPLANSNLSSYRPARRSGCPGGGCG